jgi:hypothetical protein
MAEKWKYCARVGGHRFSFHEGNASVLHTSAVARVARCSRTFGQNCPQLRPLSPTLWTLVFRVSVFSLVPNATRA